MLIMCNPGHLPLILWSCKDVTQLDLMAMVLYGVGLIPLVEMLHHAFPDVLQLWYADDSALMGKYAAKAKCLKLLKQVGPWFGYFPKPEKLLHICRSKDEDLARTAFVQEGLTVWFCRSNCYVGGFIGLGVAMFEWIAPM